MLQPKRALVWARSPERKRAFILVEYTLSVGLKNIIRSFFVSLIFLPLFLVLSCGQDQQIKNRTQSSADLAGVALSGKPFEDILSSYGHDQLDLDGLWSLSNADFAVFFARNYLAKQAVMSGSLPQVLLPQVRQGVRNNEKMKLLLKLSDIAGDLGAIIRELFANDSQLAKYIREAIGEIISKTYKSPFRLDSALKFNADAFSSPLLNESFDIPGVQDQSFSFSVKSQAVRWVYLLSRPQVWKGDPSPSSSYLDPSLQMLHLFRTLMEWNYVFGLTRNDEGTPFGGLTLAVDEASEPAKDDDRLMRFDPREEYEKARCIAGVYSVGFQNKSLFDLAMEGGEVWRSSHELLDLEEQATTWIASAVAFHRLRPANRPSHLELFGSDHPLPESAHLLPLAFLPSMEQLLDGPFISAEDRFIRQHACFNCAQDVKMRGASFKTQIRFIKAASLWAQELMDVEDLKDLDQAVITRLKAAPTNLVRAVQLGLQNMFMEFARSVVLPDGRSALMLIEKNSSSEAVDVAGVAEAVVTLTDIEQKLLKSKWLREKVGLVNRWLLHEVFLKIATGHTEGSPKLVAKDVFWMFQAFKTYEKLNFDDGRPLSGVLGDRSVLQNALTLLEKILKAWDESFL